MLTAFGSGAFVGLALEVPPLEPFDIAAPPLEPYVAEELTEGYEYVTVGAVATFTTDRATPAQTGLPLASM